MALHVRSRLGQGEVLAEVDLPTRNPPRVTRLRVREAHGVQAKRTFKTLVKAKKPARHH